MTEKQCYSFREGGKPPKTGIAVNVSNPVTPTEASFYDTEGGGAVAVAGDYAYVATGAYVAGYGGLHIINISDPVSPTGVGFCDMPGWGGGVAVAPAGDYAYVADYYSLRVVDVSNPSSPSEVGFYDTPGDAYGVAVVPAGDYAYIADGWRGLRVVDVSDPTDPTEVGYYDTLAGANGVAVAGDYAYITDWSSGLIILRYTGGGPAYSISGHVQDSSGNPISGVTVSAGAGGSATTDASGAYVITNLVTGTYTVTPIKTGWTFEPPTRTVSVPPDATGIDFTGRLNFSVSHIEVTQAVQDESHSIPLIEGKRTFVRVYVDCGPSGSLPDNASIHLQGDGPSGPLGPPQLPLVGYLGEACRQSFEEQQRDPRQTLNFTLPLEWSTGTITLTAEVNGAAHSRTVTFQPARTLRIIYVPIQYKDQSPDLNQISTGFLWASRIYPTAQINYVRGTTLEWDLCLKENFFLCPRLTRYVNTVKLLNALTTQYRLINAYIYGWLPEGTFGGGISDPTWFGGSGKAAFGDAHSTEGQRIFAHEVAHLMGRHHTNTVANLTDSNCKTNTEGITDVQRAIVDPDSDWDFPNAKIQDYGLDGYGFGWLISSSNVVKDPTKTYDYMSYCGSLENGNSWTSGWTYEHLYSEFFGNETNVLANSPLTTSQPYVIVSGLVYTDDTTTFDPMWVITSTIVPDNPPVGTQYCLEAQAAADTVLAEHCFDLTFVNYETGETTDVDGFNLMLPYPDGVTRIVLKKGDSELVVQTVSAHAPTVTVTSPNGGESWSASGTYTITWSASDADGDSLTYSILHSPDGSSWVPVGTIITQTQLAVNAAELAGGDEARIKVLASDGINTSSDESDDVFSVGQKPPSAYIISPEDGIVIPSNLVLWLEGYAYDLEDGVLEEVALQWSSNQDGILDTGSVIMVTLSPGQHVITLTATDGDDNVATDSVNVFVGYRIYLPLIARNYTPLRADFTASPTSGPAPLTVVFTNTSTGPYTSSLWAFGDGSTVSNVTLTTGSITSTQTSPTYTHTYTAPGAYTVTLTVSRMGEVDTLTRTNYITAYAPVQANFTATPTTGVAPLAVVFTNTSTGTYTASLWAFGDGSTVSNATLTTGGITSTLESLVYTYTTPGTYTVTLTVGGPGGTDTLSRTNYITAYAPVQAGFTATPTTGVAPLTVIFTNTSTGAYTSSLWAFGDGSTVSNATLTTGGITNTLESLVYTYTTPGAYTVTLTVGGPGGTDTLTRANYITATSTSAGAVDKRTSKHKVVGNLGVEARLQLFRGEPR